MKALPTLQLSSEVRHRPCPSHAATRSAPFDSRLSWARSLGSLGEQTIASNRVQASLGPIHQRASTHELGLLPATSHKFNFLRKVTVGPVDTTRLWELPRRCFSCHHDRFGTELPPNSLWVPARYCLRARDLKGFPCRWDCRLLVSSPDGCLALSGSQTASISW